MPDPGNRLISSAARINTRAHYGLSARGDRRAAFRPEETVNPECPITELGVDSLLLVLGAQRVQHDLKIQIQVHEMLEPGSNA